MDSRYNLTGDPLFYIMVAFFALLTTALPVLGGLSRLMPALQALCLTTFAALAIRQRQPGRAAAIAAIWIVVQFAALVLLTWLFVERTERAVIDGFAQRGAILDWLYAQGPFPGSLADRTWTRLAELAGVTLGSLLTAGYIGFWSVVKAVNLGGFQVGVLVSSMDRAAMLPAALHLWTLLRLAGSIGLVLLFAEPMLTRNWSPVYYVTQRRGLLLTSVALLALGLLLELATADLWRGWFAE